MKKPTVVSLRKATTVGFFLPAQVNCPWHMAQKSFWELAASGRTAVCSSVPVMPFTDQCCPGHCTPVTCLHCKILCMALSHA
nr:MAG TPA: hypothetical protein [Caudoviricetes sp.]